MSKSTGAVKIGKMLRLLSNRGVCGYCYIITDIN